MLAFLPNLTYQPSQSLESLAIAPCQRAHTHQCLLSSYLKLIIIALLKIPAQKAILYRGVNRALAKLDQKFEKGKPVVWWPVSSTASHVSVLENPQFMGKTGDRCLFTINAQSARDIQRYSAMGSTEGEYVLLPGCCLMVEDTLDAGSGLMVVQLAEDPSKMLLKFTLPSASATAAGGGAAVHTPLHAAVVHTSPPLSLPAPGKYLVCFTFAQNSHTYNSAS